MAEEVMVFKLTSGDEIIAKIVETTDSGDFKIINPMGIGLMQQAQGQFGVAMGPCIAGNKDIDMILLKANLLFEPYKAAAELETQYRTAVSPIDQSATTPGIIT